MSWKDKGRPLDAIYWAGKHNGVYGWLRQPKTTQERRLWDSEYGRSRRAPHRLPEAWDDIHRQVQRSWKEHRRTQYKELKLSTEKGS